MPAVQIQIGERTYTLSCDGAKSILDTALENAIDISYSCKRGDCGQCKGTLLSGSVAPILENRLWQEQQDVFLCNVSVNQDTAIRIPYFPELAGIRTQRTPAKVHAICRLSANVIELTLRLPPTTQFAFLPGQFIRITRQGITRSYSLANGPAEDGLLRLHIKQVPHGTFSGYLFGSAKAGDLLHIDGPHGHFFIRNAQRYKRSIFLGTGTGIAPLYAMLSSLSQDQRERLGEIDLYWGNRYARDEYLTPQLEALAGSIGARYWPVRSSESTEIRYVQNFMLAHQSHKLDDCIVFACGNVAMINSAKGLCRNAGLADDHFLADPFTQS